MRSILVADDEGHVRRLIQLKLEQEGFRVEVAANGEQALEKLGQQRFDALVTDLRMPKMNGLELAEKVRRELADGELPIIVLTSRTELDLRTWVQALGNAHFLEKPVSMQRLIERLYNALDGDARQGQGV